MTNNRVTTKDSKTTYKQKKISKITKKKHSETQKIVNGQKYPIEKGSFIATQQ